MSTRRRTGLVWAAQGLVLLAACAEDRSERESTEADAIIAKTLVPIADVASSGVIGRPDSTNLYSDVDDGTTFKASDDDIAYVGKVAGSTTAAFHEVTYASGSGIVTRAIVHVRARQLVEGTKGSIILQLFDEDTQLPAAKVFSWIPGNTWQNKQWSIDHLSVPLASLRTRIVLQGAATAYTQIFVGASIKRSSPDAGSRDADDLTSDSGVSLDASAALDGDSTRDASFPPDSESVSPDARVSEPPDSGSGSSDGGASEPSDSGSGASPDASASGDSGSTATDGASPPIPTAGDSGVAAIGTSVNGFPNWSERVLLEWTNRARVDPSVEMAACGSACGEAACYSPRPPLDLGPNLNRSARFNSIFMGDNNYFAHSTPCTLVPNLDSLYPGTCDGLAECSCAGGAISSTLSTDPFTRMSLFGASGHGEIIAATPNGDPNTAFYLWLFEGSAATACSFSASNGHRWLILSDAGPDVGFGNDPASEFTGDFGRGGGTSWRIPSGSHYPRFGVSVQLWANWHDSSGPQSAQVNIDGGCSNMTLARGTAANGAYEFTATGLLGCARYFFSFIDASGVTVTYPTVGSLGIGDAACPDWDPTRPAHGSGCL
jgi:uncharacterized protein YkwD